MIVLACGGRAYSDIERVAEELSLVHALHDIEVLVHGGADGADYLAGQWARAEGITVRVYPANWHKYGRAAGPIRNGEMLAAEPDIGLVVAFPGDDGTDDMMKKARAAGIDVHKVTR